MIFSFSSICISGYNCLIRIALAASTIFGTSLLICIRDAELHAQRIAFWTVDWMPLQVLVKWCTAGSRFILGLQTEVYSLPVSKGRQMSGGKRVNWNFEVEGGLEPTCKPQCWGCPVALAATEY